MSDYKFLHVFPNAKVGSTFNHKAELLGCSCDSVETGKNALNYAIIRHYSLIVLDTSMLDFDPLVFMRCIHELKPDQKFALVLDASFNISSLYKENFFKNILFILKRPILSLKPYEEFVSNYTRHKGLKWLDYQEMLEIIEKTEAYQLAELQ